MAAKYEVPMLLQAQAAMLVDVNTAADKLTFSVHQKCSIYRSQVTCLTTDAGGFTMAFDQRITAGSDTGRVAVYAGNVIVTAANNQGKTFYDVAEQGSILVPGDEVVAEVTAEAAGASTNVVPQVLVFYIPETEANQTDMTETA